MDWVVTVEDWAEIRRLHAQEQLSIRAIAKHLGIARDTVARRWSRSGHRVVCHLREDFPRRPALRLGAELSASAREQIASARRVVESPAVCLRAR